MLIDENNIKDDFYNFIAHRIISPIDARYNFKSDLFSLGIFTHRDVPLAPIDDDTEKIEIELEAVNTNLKCPQKMSFDGSSLRVFWFNFDHYSDYAPSHTIEIEHTHLLQRSKWKILLRFRESIFLWANP